MQAHDFLNETTDTNGEYKTYEHTFEVWDCHHYGNCDCGGREVTRTVGYYEFADGSVYIDEFGERAFNNEDDMYEWIGEQEIEEDDPCHCRDHCYC